MYCQACLCKNRNLCHVSKLEDLLQANALWELLSSEGGICWECHHIINKFSILKQRIIQAQTLLRDAKNKNFSPLTKLGTKTICENEYSFSHDPLANQEQDAKKTTDKEIINEEEDLDNHENTELEVIIKEEINSFKKQSSDDEELFDEDTDEVKLTNDIYVDVLKKAKVKTKRVKKKIGKESEKEVREKFTRVVFTEEEMLKNREDKRNQPNFKKIPFKCDTCVLGFTRKDTYDLHIEKKHDESVGPYTCPVCEARFTTTKKVSRHKSKHYVCYRCKLCKYETLELWSALSHCRTKHVDDQIERIHCGCCPFVAKTPEELSQHTTSEHSVYCHDCGEKFKALSTLRTHIRRIHRVKREFVCSICARSFTTNSRLESHMVGHNAALAQRLAYCAPCRTQYKNIYVYRNHLKTSAIHADQSYQCGDCNKWFASKVYWKKHYNFYHLHKSQFHCDICNKLFISDWRLKNHRQTQHGLSRSRDHHCNVCGKQFYTLSTLKGHQLTHSEQRSFMCEDCGDTFKQRPALYTHCKLVHRGLKRRKKVA